MLSRSCKMKKTKFLLVTSIAPSSDNSLILTSVSNTFSIVFGIGPYVHVHNAYDSPDKNFVLWDL